MNERDTRVLLFESFAVELLASACERGSPYETVMAVWQASFDLVPRERVPELFPGWFDAPFEADYVEMLPAEDPTELDCWTARQPPTDFRDVLDRLVPRRSNWSPDVERWGSEDGDRVDVFSTNGRIESIYARFDMRAPNERFIAGIASLAVGMNCDFLGHPGMLYEGSRGGLAVALRNSPALRFVEDPMSFLSRVRGGR